MSAPEQTVIAALHALEHGDDPAMGAFLLQLGEKDHAELVQILLSSTASLLAVLRQYADALGISREEMGARFEAAWHHNNDDAPRLRLVEPPP